MTEDIVALDARAVRASMRVVAEVTDADLGRPTPCAGWTLADLIAHMTGQHEGFAAAARGEGADLSHWAPRDSGPAGYAEAAERVLAAFAADGVLDRKFSVPEISPRIAFPARQAIGFHFLDYVVHGWDVARSLGLGYDLEPDLLQAVYRGAMAVPGGERRLLPGAAFAPKATTSADPGTLDATLALLGRDPEWRKLP
jgi:uncharacterized protein (TIGR03086 family)